MPFTIQIILALKIAVGECGDFFVLIQQKTVTKFIVTVSAWQLVPTRLFALGFLLG